MMDDILSQARGHEFPVAIDPELAEHLLALRRAERALRRFEARLRSPPGAMDVGVASIDTDGRLLSVTSGLCEIIGYPAETVVGTRLEEISHPGDPGPDAGLLQQVMAGNLDGYSVEKRFIRRDGGVAECRMSVTLLWDVLHRPMYHVAVIVDIGRQRRLQRARDRARAEIYRRSGLLDARLRGDPAGVMVIDNRTGTILYCSDRAASILSFPLRFTCDRIGYPDVMSVIDARRPDGTPYPVDKGLLSLTLTGDDFIRREDLVCKSRDGGLVRMTVTSAPIRDRKGEAALTILGLQTCPDLSPPEAEPPGGGAMPD